MLPRFVFSLLLFLPGCTADAPPDRAGGGNAPGAVVPTVVRPYRAPPAPGGGVAAFSTQHYTAGRVRAGRTVRHTFTLTNTGSAPLRILSVATSCGCTAASYPSEPIDTGQRGEIRVSLHTSALQGLQRKAIAVRTDGTPFQTTLYLSADVLP